MSDHSPGTNTDDVVPDYDLAEFLTVESSEQFKAILDDTRSEIIKLLEERAATTTELADALDRPKGTIGYHLGVLEEAGLITVVRTEQVRAITAKYYGRTARTFVLAPAADVDVTPNFMLANAAAEIGAAAEHFDPDLDLPSVTTLRHARIEVERAREFSERLIALVDEFVTAPRHGDVVYGMAVAVFPTTHPTLPPLQRR